MEAESQIRIQQAFRLSLGVCLQAQGWEVGREEKWLRRL